MIEWLDAPDDVVAVRYTGKVTKADVDETFRVVRERLAKHQTIASLVDLRMWDGFTAEGLLEDIREAFPALGWADRVRRKALISDSRTFAAWVAFGSSLMHRPELRAFPASQADEAMRWACETTRPTVST